MARNDEGEFELVLGNRQLISVFLIVVILLGVFFSMGYIVGRNSSPTGGMEVAKNGGSKAASEPPADTPPATSPEPSPQASAPPPVTKTPPPERVTTHAEQPAAEAPPAKPTPVSPAPAKEKKSPAPPPPARSERAPVTGEPPTGDYWQVVATARPDAEIVAEALTKKGLHAIVAPAPRDGIFRVLVGPLSDSATQAQTRTQLEAAGFKNPIVRKY